MTPIKHSDREELQQLLDESLSDAAETSLTAHLASCPECRRELELLAAKEDLWTEASERLSVSPAERSGAGPALAATHDFEAEQFPADFAVDFLEPSSEPANLGRLGEYEIVEIIGRGGMGIVLKGFQKELHRHVAVKVLSPHLATSGAARLRFTREAQATAAVVHPHVMAIHSVNANAKLPYLVMPYVACQSLQDRLDKQGPLDLKDILRIGMQAASGLAAAHAQGLVHRDVKPANILLETNVDRVLLTDFGLARAVNDASLTRTGVIAGTPQYMSPEQANGDAIDARSDLFSLGSVLYAMCTGRPPFRADSTFAVLRRIRETAPRSIREINPEIPEWLERTVLKLLEKEPDDRLASAQEVASLLEHCLAHVQQPATAALPGQIQGWRISSDQGVHRERLTDWLRAKAAGTAVAVSCLVLLGVLLNDRWSGLPFLPASANRRSANVPVFGQDENPAVQSPALDQPLEWNALQSGLSAAGDDIERLETQAQGELDALAEQDVKVPPSRQKEE